MKNGKIIRSALVILPLGLFTLGMVSVVVTHVWPDKLHSSADESLDIRMEAARMKQKPVNETDLRTYVSTLSDRIGERHMGKPEKLNQAALWIESTLGPANTGYLVIRQSYAVGKESVRNLIAELPGNTRPSEIIVVGAHYDSAPNSPAANDNASGVAAMIALARAFAGEQQARTIQFVAFVNEEPPHFQTEEMGSFVFATEAKYEGAKIKAMISLESLGYYSDEEGSQSSPEGLETDFPKTGNFVAFLGNTDSAELAETARDAFFLASPIPAVAGGFPESITAIGASDHWPFWQNGYPAIMVTDTAPFRYPHYQLPTDTIDKLDYEKLTSVVTALKNVITTLANP